MGQDGNTIEIEIDAAATVAAAKTAGEANAKLVKFDQALGLFRDNVGLVSKTTEDVATRMGDFNTILQKFSDNLTTNLADMQTSVVQKIEPHLERELENMVNRVLNKVEGKSAPEQKSRARSEAKQGAAAPTVTNTTAANVATAKQDSEFKRPDAIIKQMSSQIGSTVQDAITGAFTDTKTSRMRTEVTRTKLRQYSDVETGEQLEERTVTTDISNAISKAVVKSSDAFGKAIPLTGENKKMADLFNFLQNPVSARPSKVASGGLQSISDALDQSLGKGFADPLQQYGKGMNAAAEQNIWRPYEKALNDNEKAAKSATVAEKDRGIAIRREITGALIGLHVMKVVSQYSAVANAGFMMVFAALGHLLNNILLPMMPAFIIFAQLLHTVANVIQMLPMPLRQVIGALLIWKATSMLIAAMPIKDIVDGMRGLVGSMKDAGSGLKGFLNLVRAFIDFMNSGQGKGAVSWIGGGLGKAGGAIAGGAKRLLGKRAGGGPVLGHGAYIVGEKGPEIFVPKTSGSIIPNHKIGRADGVGDVAAAPTGSQAPILPDIGSTLLGGAMGAGLGYMFTGSPLVAAGGGILGAAAGASGADIIGTIAGGVGAMMSNDTVQGIMGGMHLLTNTLAAFLAPIAPMLGVIAGVVGVASGVRSGLGGGDGGKTAETVATVGKAQLKQTAAMSYGVQNTVNAGTRGTSSSLMALLLRMNGCIKTAPCSPDAYVPVLAPVVSILTSIPLLIAGALSLALAGILSPILSSLAATITYSVAVIGNIPVAENIERFITWTRRVVGEIPEAIGKEATITYNIVKNGIEPTVTNATVKITYLIEKVGEVPTVKDATAKITYAIETIGELPVVKDATSWISVKINELTDADYLKLKADIEAKAAANPPTITSKVLADGTVEGGVPTIDVTAKVTAIDVTGLTDAQKTIPDATAKVTTANVDAVKGVEIPATGVVDGLSGTGIVEVSPGVYAYKDALDVQTRVKLGLVTPEEYAAYLKDLAEKADASKPKIPTVLTTDGKLTSVDGKPLNVELPATVKTVEGNYGSWEISSDGSMKYIGTVIEIPSEMGDPKPVDPAKIDPVKLPVTVEPELPGGYSLKSLFEKASRAGLGEILGLGVVLAIDEYARTGTVKLVDLLVGLGLGTLTFAGAEAVLTSVAGSLGGAAAAGAVGLAFGAIGVTLSGLIAGGVATSFLQDLNTGMQESIDSGGATFDFGNFILNAAASLGSDFNTYLEENLNIDIPEEAFRLAGIGMNAAGQLIMNPSSEWPRILGDFINDLKTTVAGGIPVDVKIDVDSVTSVVQQIGEASNLGGYTGPVVSDPGVGGGQPPINDPIQIGGNDPMGPDAPPVETPVAYDPNNPEGLPTWVNPNPPSQCPEGQYFDSSLGVCVGGYAVGGRPPVNVPSLVGERGPELFIPDSSPTSIGGGGGSGGSVTNNFTFNVTTNNPRELTDTVMKELKMELARVKM